MIASLAADLQPGHLIRRFFAFTGAQPLSTTERDEVLAWLDASELQSLFFDQPLADQRHGYDSARWVAERIEVRWLAQAALLHDIGKRHAEFGRWRRSIATVAAAVGVGSGGRIGIYTAHGSAGALELEAAGADPRVVAYTRHHHGARVDELSEDEWDLLDTADHRN